jgi:hypothetical protein
MGNQRHGRKSRAASPKRKRGESTSGIKKLKTVGHMTAKS